MTILLLCMCEEGMTVNIMNINTNIFFILTYTNMVFHVTSFNDSIAAF